jgi:hypothetical protein
LKVAGYIPDNAATWLKSGSCPVPAFEHFDRVAARCLERHADIQALQFDPNSDELSFLKRKLIDVGFPASQFALYGLAQL